MTECSFFYFVTIVDCQLQLTIRIHHVHYHLFIQQSMSLYFEYWALSTEKPSKWYSSSSSLLPLFQSDFSWLLLPQQQLSPLESFVCLPLSGYDSQSALECPRHAALFVAVEGHFFVNFRMLSPVSGPMFVCSFIYIHVWIDYHIIIATRKVASQRFYFSNKANQN